jgi:putative PEP-CTERM system integral membrane protein
MKESKSWHSWAYGLFWSWNLIFLAFMSLGFAPLVLPEMIRGVRTGTIPAAFLVYAAVLTAIPAATVMLGLTRLRRAPGQLLTLGYGIEGPLMLGLGLRFFVLREVTPPVALLLGVAGLGMATLLWQTLDRDVDQRHPALAYLRVGGLTLLLFIGLYASAWSAFYALPVGILGWRLVAGSSLGGLDLEWLLFWLLGTTLLAYTATLFAVMPVAVPVLYVRAWWCGLRAFVVQHGRARAVALTTVVLVACLALLARSTRQPQSRAFALLETPPDTPAAAQALLDQQESIREGLLNAYLAPYRYVSAVGEVRHVSDMYEAALGLAPRQARGIQRLYETVARPLLYVPADAPESDDGADNRALREEPAKAAKLYKQFFDQPIVTGERDAVVRAVRSTWAVDQAQSAWQAVDDREVYLLRQEITVNEHDDWAEVELYEVYQNQTGQRQEVVYYFSLPESAVITGVWLGASPDRATRFAYRVAPRGAAQAVYRNEVRYNRDPALVEQIGPRQYRLRVFPVEPESWRWSAAENRSLFEAAPPLHMWLTWRVLASDDAWPLPRLAEKRNVYWDDKSVRLIGGESMEIGDAAWLLDAVAATWPVEPVAHRVDLAGGETVLIRPAQAKDLPAPPADLRLAVVLDRSRSMAGYATDVQATLARLSEMADAGATVDVYLTASAYRGEEASRVALAELDFADIVYYGGQNAVELLAQFEALRADQEYDAILVFTDGSGYELGPGEVEVPLPDAPLWMVHLGGDFPLGYDDATLEAIQASGGGVTGGVEEALTRLAVALEGEPGVTSRDVMDGYVWSSVSTEALGAGPGGAVAVHTAADDFAAFAARRLILAETSRQRDALDQLDTLDQLHALAIQYSIVTPYSSMIVLVNQQQERLLNELEALNDRFEREHEDVGETMPKNALGVTGVPEPEEWLLLALAAALLVWFVRKSKLAPQRVHTV